MIIQDVRAAICVKYCNTFMEQFFFSKAKSQTIANIIIIINSKKNCLLVSPMAAVSGCPVATDGAAAAASTKHSDDLFARSFTLFVVEKQLSSQNDQRTSRNNGEQISPVKF